MWRTMRHAIHDHLGSIITSPNVTTLGYLRTTQQGLVVNNWWFDKATSIVQRLNKFLSWRTIKRIFEIRMCIMSFRSLLLNIILILHSIKQDFIPDILFFIKFLLFLLVLEQTKPVLRFLIKRLFNFDVHATCQVVRLQSAVLVATGAVASDRDDFWVVVGSAVSRVLVLDQSLEIILFT